MLPFYSGKIQWKSPGVRGVSGLLSERAEAVVIPCAKSDGHNLSHYT